MENKSVVKCLKSYLTGKKYYETDVDKSFEYFKQCINILNDIKEQKIKVNDDISMLIDETETECSKYLTKVIETNIDKPSIKLSPEKRGEINELFKIIETGDINKLKEYKYGDIDFKVYDEEGNTPLHKAIKYGDTTFLKNAFRLGASIDMTNKMGRTLLDYACLEKDPNLINFIILYGADMKKHLRFREGNKYNTNGTQIDIMLLEKILLESSKDNMIKYTMKHLDWIFNYINKNTPLELSSFTVEHLIMKIDKLISTFPEETRNTFITIIKEELSNELHVKLGCPTNMIEILLYNIVPFIDYKENLRLNWLISLEIKFLILKILKNKEKINTKELKQQLRELIYNSYIKSPIVGEIIPEGMINTLVLQWVNKIKV